MPHSYTFITPPSCCCSAPKAQTHGLSEKGRPDKSSRCTELEPKPDQPGPQLHSIKLPWPGAVPAQWGMGRGRGSTLSPFLWSGLQWDSKPYPCPLKTHVPTQVRGEALGQTDRLLETAPHIGSGFHPLLLLCFPPCSYDRLQAPGARTVIES